jgi:hypothetical protein
MVTFEDLQGRILRMIGDAEGAVYQDDRLRDAINAALDAILQWIPKLGMTTFTGDGSTMSFALPSDCYDVEAIVAEATGEALSRIVFAPGVVFSSLTSTENLWIFAPSDQITFAKAIPDGSVYDVRYLSAWAKISDTTVPTTAIEPPDWTVVGLTLYATAYLLTADSLDTANLRQYNTRVDSGNPEHNPIQKSVSYLLTLFNQEMNRHPRYQRAQV